MRLHPEVGLAADSGMRNRYATPGTLPMKEHGGFPYYVERLGTNTRLRVMTRLTAVLGLLVCLPLAACGRPSTGPPSAHNPSPSTTAVSGESGSNVLFEANATVLENDKGETNLCLGVMLDSLPPQCGDVPLMNWDWNQVKGEERAGGVTWGGSYHVVGSFDGETFTLTDKPGPPAEHLIPEDDFSSAPACEEPAHGWIEEGEVDQQVAGRALSHVRREPEYSAGWVTQLEPPGVESDTGAVVLNAAFTGNLDKHEASLREHWNGSLCIVRYGRSMDELEQIRTEVYAMLEELSVRTLTSDLDEIDNSINVHVIHIDETDREGLMQRFDSETVEITTAFRPLES